MAMNNKINIITLGCSKNTVDSEQLAAQLLIGGYDVVHNSNELDFQIAIVNTCGFIKDAKEESINTILELVNAKENQLLDKIIVFGCLSERYMQDLKAELPEVDVMLGNYNCEQLLGILEQSVDLDHKYGREFIGETHYAYLKIAEGCNRNCAFCAIPLFKGKYISRPMQDILDEAKELAKRGIKEILLIAQDISYYGYDVDRNLQLPDLVSEISKIDGIEWIRLHYLYPFLFPEKIIEIIAENPKVCKYIDIPLQHISNKVLKAMNRGGTKEQTIELLDKIKTKIPDAVVRTTMLVGHPEEGDEEFDELMEFVKQQKFDRLGVFTYSEEDGTIAAKKYKDSISDKIKNKREAKLMELQSEISYELNSLKIGKKFKIIIDKKEGDIFIGRTEYDSVEVDNEVVIENEENLSIGEFYLVEIIDFDEYSLFAKIVDER